MMRIRAGVLSVCVLCAAFGTLRGAEGLAPGAPASAEAPRPYTFRFAPPRDFYPVYLADPRRPQSALLLTSIIDSEIPKGGQTRWITRLGGRFPLVRAHPVDRPEIGFQLDFEAGFFGHFDLNHGDDNIGWDGVFGLLLSYKPQPAIALRFGLQHDSAHVGDEYEERLGRQRVDYTRQELAFGASWAPVDHWRGYLEAAHGFSDMKDFQEPLRLQGGVEYVSRQSWRDGRFRWYAAADVTSFEERDWKITTTVQLGFILHSETTSGRYRLALEYGTGRSAMGEFFFHDESYLALGWYYDF